MKPNVLERTTMSLTALTVTATFEDGVLRPDEPLPLSPRQRVTLVVQIPEQTDDWPENVADIYREIADEDRRLSAAMFSTVHETWPAAETQS
jgi:predicted DNA-binding antitoxin AbrB/MazE fold protein